ncbi:MAG: hypothetical protein QOD41_3137 [Cryptosporangiaceae bacterium]|nr:hypothetical protein [Cryptosporangiaceae bacterium]
MRIRNRVSITVLTTAALVLPLAGIRAASAAPPPTAAPSPTALAASAERGLADRTLAGSAAAAYAYYRDGAGRLIVETAPANTALTRTLRDDYGPAVTVVPHAVSRAIRTADDGPHYGGARLHLKNYSAGCSSGVTLVRAGVRHMVTAGHCYSTGTNVYSGQFYFGLVNIRHFPNPDLELINGNPGTSGQGAQSYGAYVYTDPSAPGVAAVATRWTTPVGGYVCTDGSYSQERCGARVATTTASFCDSDGCTYNLARAQQPGKLVAQLGDSGGPVYQKPTATTVAFQGIIVATSLNLSSTSGDTVWFHTLGTIESSLGGPVLTGSFVASDPTTKH